MRILSLNIHQLPFYVDPDLWNDAKMHKICDFILAQPGLTVVCFQELFRGCAREIVKQRLGHRYPYMRFDTSYGKYLVGVNSGLAIISQSALSGACEYEYSARQNIEYLAEKGVMGTMVAIPFPLQGLIPRIYLFTTHLQSGQHRWDLCFLDKRSPAEIKHDQIREACSWIHLLVYNADNALILLCGDFNLNSNEGAITTIREKFPYARDAHDVANTQNLFSVADNKRLDYCYVLSSPAGLDVRSVLENVGPGDFTLTDHRAVNTSIQVKYV